jgi:hypothetical protein
MLPSALVRDASMIHQDQATTGRDRFNRACKGIKTAREHENAIGAVERPVLSIPKLKVGLGWNIFFEMEKVELKKVV